MKRRNEPTDWMWAQACDLMEQAERMHRQFFRVAPGRAEAMWEPPVDMFENEHEIVVLVAMPGVADESVQVLVQPGAVVVRGERVLPCANTRHAIRQLEIPYGYFERRIALPAVPLEAASRELSHGCLILRLRKVPA